MLAPDALLGNSGANRGHRAVRDVDDKCGLRCGAPSDDGVTGSVRCESCVYALSENKKYLPSRQRLPKARRRDTAHTTTHRHRNARSLSQLGMRRALETSPIRFLVGLLLLYEA